MGDAARPQRTQQELAKIAALLDAGELIEAQAALDALTQTLTEQDVEVHHLRAMLSFLEE